MATQTTTGYVDIGDGKLYYEVAGAGETLVLGHAGFVDSGMWDAQWDELAQHHQVIRYDMRGYGKSDFPSGPVNRRQDLFQLLQHLHIERATLLGCSLGGTIMLDFALEHPQMVSALILVSSAPGGFQLQGEPPPNIFAMFPAMQQGDTARVSELQIQLWVDGPFRQPDQVDPDVRRHAAEMNLIPARNNTWLKVDMQPNDPLAPPAVEHLHDIHAPTLIIAGVLDNPEILRAADVLAAGIAGAKKVIIADAAHMPNMEKPAEFTQAVLSFWDGLK
jgi:pimeloyl-ACP methyl ester carboxylesterase